ncbi:MAG: ATP-binding cassette domain-containing protein [Proteobacteria bacterium]|nr:ATP-binding cassette domain-containing protein [Pseudomonadota bacterium]
MITTAQDHQFIRQSQALRGRLGAVLWHHYQEHSVLELAFCGLVLKVNPSYTMRRLYDALPYKSDVLGVVDLLNSMSNLGYGYHTVETSMSAVDGRLMPCLFVQSKGLGEVPTAAYLIIRADEDGKRVVLNCRDERIDTLPADDPLLQKKGTIYTFQPLKVEQQATSAFIRKGTGHSWFRAMLTRFTPILRQVLMTGLFLNVAALTMPLFIMMVYDRVIAARAVDSLYFLVSGVAIAISFEWLLRTLRSSSLSWLAARLDGLVGNAVFAQLIQLPPSVIEQASVAAQIARIKTFEYVRDFFSGPVFLSVMEMPFVLLALALIALIAGPLVWVPIIMASVYLMLFYLMRQRIRVIIRLAAKASSVRQQFTVETLEKIEAIRMHGLSQVWYEKFRRLSGQEYLAHFQLNQAGVLAETLAHTLTVLSAVAVLLFGVNMVWQGSMSAGALVATMILVWRVLTPLHGLCSMILRLEQLTNSIRQVNQLMDMETEFAQSQRKARLRHLRGHVTFFNVTLKYDSQADPVFHKLSFEAKPGDVLMLTGLSGSGKTSILKLIQGLYLPHSGTVRIDGFDIRQLNTVELRQQIAYVPQRPDFFHGTIEENLHFVRPDATEVELWEALRLAGAEDVVNTLPSKLKTVIAQPGEEQQYSVLYTQLSLARMYLQNAPLVLIDELPNAVLNSHSGQLLKAYIRRAKGKRTIIMTSYRKEFLELADEVLSLHAQTLFSHQSKKKNERKTQPETRT